MCDAVRLSDRRTRNDHVLEFFTTKEGKRVIEWFAVGGRRNMYALRTDMIRCMLMLMLLKPKSASLRMQCEN